MGTDIADLRVSDMPSLKVLLLMLVALGILTLGFWRLSKPDAEVSTIR